MVDESFDECKNDKMKMLEKKLLVDHHHIIIHRSFTLNPSINFKILYIPQ